MDGDQELDIIKLMELSSAVGKGSQDNIINFAKKLLDDTQ